MGGGWDRDNAEIDWVEVEGERREGQGWNDLWQT